MNNKENVMRILDEYFLNINDDILKIEDKEFVKHLLSDYIAEKKKNLIDEKLLIKLLNYLYSGESSDTNQPAVMIHRFIEETGSYQIAAIFKNDIELAGALKNLYMFDLIEKIRFSKMQKESLRDTSTYNRHIEKALTEMRNDLCALFELGADYGETLPVIEKYYEFNRYVNTTKGWNEFYSLKDYPQFQQYLIEREDSIIQDYEQKGLLTESIQTFLDAKNEKAAAAFERVTDEIN